VPNKPTPEDMAALTNIAPQFGFSIQNGGMFITLHLNMPYVSIACGIPVEGADAFADDFAKNVKELAAQARRAQSPLVVANQATLNVLKGK
jgi:hypothetical protein